MSRVHSKKRNVRKRKRRGGEEKRREKYGNKNGQHRGRKSVV